MVQTNTVIGPGGEAGVMRIKGTGTAGHERGLAMALDGNGRWAYLDPKLGAMHAVAESARKVASCGATPVAATNCLNFGNPEKPEIMAQLSAAIDGIGEACTALGTPITGGNVSLYNETRGEGIYPTPVLGIVGILEDVTKAVPAHFQAQGDTILLLWPVPKGEAPDPALAVPFHQLAINPYIMKPLSPDPMIPVSDLPEETSDADAAVAAELSILGSSEYAKVVLGALWGTPPPLDLDAEADLHTLLEALADRKLVHSACDLGDGGIAVALAQAGFPKGIGATVEQDPSLMAHPLFGLFSEPASTMILTAEHGKVSKIVALSEEYSFLTARIGVTGGKGLEITVDHEPFISAPLESLCKPWAQALEATLHDEVNA